MAAVAFRPPQNSEIKRVEINGHLYGDLKKPDEAKGTLRDHFINFAGSSYGAYRLIQLLQRVILVSIETLKSVGIAVGSATMHAWEEFASKLGLVWAGLIIPRLPAVTGAAKRAICDWSSPPEGPAASMGRSILQRIHDVTEAIAAWFYAASLFANNLVFKIIGDGFTLPSDVTDLTMAAQDYSLAKECSQHIKSNDRELAPIRQRFLNTMRHAWIRLIKAVNSVASGVLGFLALVLKKTLLPPLALILISLASTTSAITAHFFKETRRDELVEFHKSAEHKVLLAGSLVSVF